MTKLTDIDYLESLPLDAERIIQAINKQVFELIADRLKSIPSNTTEKLQLLADYKVTDRRKLEQILKTGEENTLRAIEKAINNISSESVTFAENYYKINKQVLNRDKDAIKTLAIAIGRRTQQEFINLSRTAGFKINGRYSPIYSAYFQLIDQAVISLLSGGTSFNKVVRDTTRKMVKSGLRGVSFDSGRTVNIVGQVRMNILQGAISTSQETLNVIGEQIGTDGFEISAHALCAEDHQSIQGRQYTREEFDRLQSDLKRPIGTLNCRHIAYPVIVGQTKPTYTNQELNMLIDKSNQVKEFHGKEYTRYNATQEQRRQEKNIRDIKYKLDIYKTLNDKDAYNRLKLTLKNKVSAYKEFSQAMDIRPKLQNLRI